MTRSALTGRAARLLRAGLHLVVAAVVLEGAARLDDRLRWGAPLRGRYDPEILREVDPAGYPRNVPGARFEKWRIDGHGFRGGEVAPQKPAGTVRIACLGQSETFGLYETEGGEWPARLQARLGATAEVVNASVVGLGRAGRAAYLDARVLPLRPDVVVLYVNVLAELSPAPAPAGFAPEPAGAHLRLLAKARVAAQGVLPDGLRRRLRAWRLARQLRAVEATAGQPPADAVPDAVVAAFEAHLAALVDTVRARGGAPMLVTYPVLGDAPDPGAFHLELADERQWHPQWSERGLVAGTRDLNEAVRRLGRARSIPVVDVAATMPRTLEYFADAVHYTDRGAAFVADRVRAALDDAGLLATARPQPLGVPASKRALAGSVDTVGPAGSTQGQGFDPKKAGFDVR